MSELLKGCVRTDGFILSIASGFDFVVIDCPPGGQSRDQRDNVSRSAALLADIVLVPLAPKPADFMAVNRLRSLLVDLCAVKPDLMVTIMINMKKVGEKMSRTARQDAFNMLDDEGLNLTVLEAEISDRNTIAGVVGLGVTVFEHQSKSSSEREAINKASTEYKALAKEIIACLKQTLSQDSVTTVA